MSPPQRVDGWETEQLLTEEERKLFEDMVKFFIANDQFPPVREVSQHSSHYRVQRLYQKGLFEKNACNRPMLTELGWQFARELVGLHPPTVSKPD